MTPKQIKEIMPLLNAREVLVDMIKPEVVLIEIKAVGRASLSLCFKQGEGIVELKSFLGTQLQEVDDELLKLGVKLDEQVSTTQNG